MRYLLTFTLLCLTAVAAWAEPKTDTITNWELGFAVDIPTTWLRYEGKHDGAKFASEDIRLDVSPFTGMTQSQQIEALRKQAKQDRYEFKEEKSYPIMQVPAHEMVFYRNGKYLIYYVLMSGQRGFILTLRSDGTDTPAFLEAQSVIANFRVMPLR